MAEQKYPIGIQSFSKLIEDGYIYVDKTHLIAKLIKEGQYFFLSRPRRFGKSLLLSTIHDYYDGKRELFKGLAIEKEDMDWTPRPVLHFDFNTGLYDRTNGLEELLDNILFKYERLYEVRESEKLNISTRFGNLIEHIHKSRGCQVVILVDEYDKPLLGLEDDSELYMKNQALLKSFFSNLKSMDRHIKFAMLTGVARFSKVSIFSDLNNLEDISMSNEFSEICGWTEDELTQNFHSGIAALAHEYGVTREDIIGKLREYYDGYLFSGAGERVYNPFSVLRALKALEIKPYWFETGTPTFLAKRIRMSGIDPAKLNGQTQNYSNLLAIGSGNDDLTALMFQTGYLTIASYDRQRQRYTLRFPNREVEIGFAENLLPLYAPATSRVDSSFNLHYFQDDLYDGNPDGFMKRLDSLFRDLPGEDHKESTYRAVTYLLCLLSGTEALAERHSYRGRSDLEVLTPNYIYIFEFKYNKSLKDAIDQIHDRDYAGRYAMDPRQIFLIGANYTEDKDSRSIKYTIEEYSH